ncbi:hypothetical protein K6119_15085 [Paracrocinitomix mangrovi]|uniref:hypothetical protein n=1 Tax=Paracrocinitomix mangrovi TaxID=2862509 RepID=UPI001C8F05F2|nr:hypothetical protein [Paracrocinitomix mangrovi]UKN01053.1 hypothetical protein K6119_15085 [Paracrocinitomix mangrovi]
MTNTLIYLNLSDLWDELLNSRNSDNQTVFNKLIADSTPELRKYIARRLRVSIKKGKLPARKYKVDDFVNELYLAAYDKITDFTSAQQFGNWLYQKTDQILEDTIVDEEFDDFFFQNIEQYTSDEWKSMEENYYMDADGDYIMAEELNDPSYPDYEYQLKDVFVDNDQDALIQKISDKLTEEEINKHIKLVVSNLPFEERVAYQLSIINRLKDVDIASITKSVVEDVSSKIKNAKDKIVKSFHSRYVYES